MTPPHRHDAAPLLTVFHDGACPLCRREVAFYRRRRGAHAIAWHDVSREAGHELYPGLPLEHARTRFHVVTADGTILSGARAFTTLWRALPGLRPLGLILGLPPFLQSLELGYRAFLPLRPRLQRWLGCRANNQSSGRPTCQPPDHPFRR